MTSGAERWRDILQLVPDVVVEVHDAVVTAWRSDKERLLLKRTAIWMQGFLHGRLDVDGDGENEGSVRKEGIIPLNAPTLVVLALSRKTDHGDALSISLDLSLNKADLWLMPGRNSAQDEIHEAYRMRSSVMPHVHELLDKIVVV